MKCVVVASTGGSVMNVLLKTVYFRNCVFAVVSDRDCPAMEKARRHEVPTLLIPERKNIRFSNRLLKLLHEHQVDYVISFFTRLFVGELLARYRDRIINLHPSLLPAFKGLDGFGDTVRYGTRYVGSTIHFMDEHMDEGKIILQTVYPLDPGKSLEEIRHRVFQQQCKSLLQVVRWLDEGRIQIQGTRVTVTDAAYTGFEYSPGLDFEDALELNIPFRRRSLE
jgi:phosphoribosylglycinamide formyltransferase-1